MVDFTEYGNPRLTLVDPAPVVALTGPEADRIAAALRLYGHDVACIGVQALGAALVWPRPAVRP